MSIDFRKQIYELARQIPAGRVATYGQLAALAGRPGCARAVGAYMRACDAPGIPCHRVVFHDGALCRGDSFGGMPALQQQLLAAEGVLVGGDGKVALGKYRVSNGEFRS